MNAVFTKHSAYLTTHAVIPMPRYGVKVIRHPDLSHVKDVPPHFWKLEKNRIIEMTPHEKIMRLAEMVVYKKHKQVIEVLYPWYIWLIPLVALAYYFRHKI